MKSNIFKTLFLVAALALILPVPAHAYLDPGTGSMVLQIIAAVFFAALFIVKGWWGKITHFVSSMFGKDKKHSEKSSKKE